MHNELAFEATRLGSVWEWIALTAWVLLGLIVLIAIKIREKKDGRDVRAE